jgi:hypothetical protein
MTADRFHPLLLVPALALVVAAGCGGSSNSSNNSSSSSSGVSDQLKEEAATKAKAAANRIVQATPDKHLPGKKRYLSVCLTRDDPGAGDIPPNIIKCHIEAFYEAYKNIPSGYIWSEDWQVPLQNGKTGQATILGQYRIRAFLQEDNRKNCTQRHMPRECLPQSVGGILPG